MICCPVVLIVLFIEKSTGSSPLVGYGGVDDEVAEENGVTCVLRDGVEFVAVLLEHLHKLAPFGLLLESSLKA